MNIYDKAYELARQIRDTDEYRAYTAIKREVFSNESDKRMIEDFRKLQFEAQAAMFSNQEPSPELMDKLQKIGAVLQFNPKITDFFAREYAMQTLAADIYKIIGDACGLETPAMQE